MKSLPEGNTLFSCNETPSSSTEPHRVPKTSKRKENHAFNKIPPHFQSCLRELACFRLSGGLVCSASRQSLAGVHANVPENVDQFSPPHQNRCAGEGYFDRNLDFGLRQLHPQLPVGPRDEKTLPSPRIASHWHPFSRI